MINGSNVISNKVSSYEHQSCSTEDTAHPPAKKAKLESYWDDSHLEKNKLYDILRYLFTFTTRQRESLGPQFTIRISLVCRSWRLIALDYAFLWNKIFCIDRLDTIHAFIDRSKGALLDIKIDAESKAWATDRLSKLIDILLPRISQLRYLSLTGRSSEVYYFLQHISANPSGWEGTYKHNLCATNLENLSLRILKFEGAPQLIHMEPWFGGNAPKLRSIRLPSGFTPLNQPFLRDITLLKLNDHTPSHISLVIAQCPKIYRLNLAIGQLPPTPLVIPTLRKLSLHLRRRNRLNDLTPCFTLPTWDGLIAVKLCHVKEGVMLETLRKTPQVEHLRIHPSVSLSPFIPPEHSEFTTTSLKKLVFLDLDRSVGKVLPYLHIPSLQDLRLGYDATISMPDLINYFARNLLPLKSLSLRGFQPNIDELRLMLVELPFLETLTATDSPDFARSLLQVFNRDPELCPRLCSLDLKTCDQNSGIDLFLYRRRQNRQ